MTAKLNQTAVRAVCGTVRQHTQYAPEAIIILTAALCFEAASNKHPKCSWSELEAELVQAVMNTFAQSKRLIENRQPNG